MNTIRQQTISIIGGGVMALFLLKAFVDQNVQNTTLEIFEANSHLGMGMPYSPDWANPEHSVNIACQEIPDLVEEPHVWLARQSEEFLAEFGIERSLISPLSILPRIVMGVYLESQFSALLSIAEENGVRVRIHLNTPIMDIEVTPDGNKVRITTSTGGEFEADQVIIATGHSWPVRNERHIPGYFDSPFPLNKLRYAFHHRVGILGSSLSAIDAIKTLAVTHGRFERSEIGDLSYIPHPGTEEFMMVMHSRRGLLPSIRFHFEHPRLQKYLYVSQEEIEENIAENNGFLSVDYVFEKSYKDTIAQYDPALYNIIKDMSIEEFVVYYYERLQSNDPFAIFAEQLQTSQLSEQRKEPIYWKEVLDDTFYTLNFHAKSLSAEDMIRLRTYLMPLSYHDGAFLPFESCEELLALHAAGKLELVTVGSDSRVVSRNGEPGASVVYTNDHGETVQLPYETFIECRGQSHLPFEAFPFKTLVRQGVITPARVRFASMIDYSGDIPTGCTIEQSGNDSYLRLPGVAFNDNFQALDRKGVASQQIYIVAVAHIKGLNPDFSGIPFSNHAAQMIIHSILTKKQAI